MSDDDNTPHKNHSSDEGLGVLTRRRLLRGAATMGGAVAVAGIGACTSDDSEGTVALASDGKTAGPSALASAASPAVDGLAGPGRSIIWALAAIAPWNLAVDVGFVEASRLLGWEYQKVGVPLEQYSPENVVNVVRRAIQARPDVLVTPGWIQGVYDAIADGQEQGILMMLNDANSFPDQAAELGVAHVGADEYSDGGALAEPLAQAATEAGKSEGTFIAGNPFPGNENLEARVRGATDFLNDWNESNGTRFAVEQFNDQSGSDDAQAISLYKAKFTELGDDLAGLIAVGENANVQVQALQERDFSPGDVALGAFEENERTYRSVMDGWVTATVGPQRYAMGFVATMIAWQALQRGVDPRSYRTGSQVVDAQTVEQALEQRLLIEELAQEYGVRLS